ncbi:hypothetical protein FRC16_006497 [Serendipita sp. 398]|nr:hypothetical protein FRC16_006497 [Serendipita sp. 398]
MDHASLQLQMPLQAGLEHHHAQYCEQYEQQYDYTHPQPLPTSVCHDGQEYYLLPQYQPQQQQPIAYITPIPHSHAHMHPTEYEYAAQYASHQYPPLTSVPVTPVEGGYYYQDYSASPVHPHYQGQHQQPHSYMPVAPMSTPILYAAAASATPTGYVPYTPVTSGSPFSSGTNTPHVIAAETVADPTTPTQQQQQQPQQSSSLTNTPVTPALVTPVTPSIPYAKVQHRGQRPRMPSLLLAQPPSLPISMTSMVQQQQQQQQQQACVPAVAYPQHGYVVPVSAQLHHHLQPAQPAQQPAPQQQQVQPHPATPIQHPSVHIQSQPPTGEYVPLSPVSPIYDNREREYLYEYEYESKYDVDEFDVPTFGRELLPSRAFPLPPPPPTAVPMSAVHTPITAVHTPVATRALGSLSASVSRTHSAAHTPVVAHAVAPNQVSGHDHDDDEEEEEEEEEEVHPHSLRSRHHHQQQEHQSQQQHQQQQIQQTSDLDINIVDAAMIAQAGERMKRLRERRHVVACLFCRGRKIACHPPRATDSTSDSSRKTGAGKGRVSTSNTDRPACE